MPCELFEERLRAHHPDFYAWERRKTDGIGMTGVVGRQGYGHCDVSTTRLRPKLRTKRIQVPSKYHPSTIQVQDLILNMSNEFMSMKSMMQVCGLKSRMTFRENYVTPALLDHAIERKYPNEPNHPRQMYRLTKQALEWKKSRED